MNYLSPFSLTDVPSAPEDISVHDIFQDSCVLKWKKPKDDGGMPIANYIIERQDLSVKGEGRSVAINRLLAIVMLHQSVVSLKKVDGIRLVNTQPISRYLSSVKD